MTWILEQGDCRERMAALADKSIDAIVTDPPYGLGFMGKGWDHGVPGVEFWAEALRVAKPGAYLVAFGGTRTYHRLTCAIEDAGWDIRDCLSWLYGSGFPKSHNGPWGGTALKPAWEPIIMARKPLVGTVAANVAAHGTGALNIDGCRIEFASEADERESKEKNRHADFGSGARENQVYGADDRTRAESGNYDAEGRWPPNVILDEDAGAVLDAQTGDLAPGNHPASRNVSSMFTARAQGATEEPRRTDAGGASRFFYCAKASQTERWEYLSCDCETPILPVWENEDQNRSAWTDSTSRGRAISEATSTDDCNSLTLPLGSASTVASPPATKSTTSTRTSKTTASTTCGSSVPPSTSESTRDASSEATNGGSPAASVESSSRSAPSTGISPVKGGRSTGVAVPATFLKSSETNNCGSCGRPLKRVGHPTVKPLALMRWLCRLVTPAGGLILDPFTGSGSTGCAALLEKLRFHGIELTPEYLPIAEARLAHWYAEAQQAQPSLFDFDPRVADASSAP